MESFVASMSRRLAIALSGELGDRNRIDSTMAPSIKLIVAISCFVLRILRDRWPLSASSSKSARTIEAIDVLCRILCFDESVRRNYVSLSSYIVQRDALIDHNYHPVEIEIRIRVVEQQ